MDDWSVVVIEALDVEGLTLLLVGDIHCPLTDRQSFVSLPPLPLIQEYLPSRKEQATNSGVPTGLHL